MTGAEAADLFDNSAKSQTLINNMINVAKTVNVVGLDLDFESINFKHSGNSATRLKANYPKFIALLKKNAGALKVSTTIPARVSDTDPDWAVYDYAAIGKVSDIVRIMSYDYHTGSDSVGPVSPLPWYVKVQTYAKSRISTAKLHMGIPAYGYNWPSGKTVNAREADALAKSNGKKVTYDIANAEGTFSYNGNTVWVATSIGMATRAVTSKNSGLAGVAIWSVGDEASDAFTLIRKAIAPAPPAPKPTPIPTPKPVVKKVSVALVQPGKKNDQVTVVQNALHRAGFYSGGATSIFDPNTVKAYSKFQQSLGYKGVDANGSPGITSLTKLGNKYGFTVTA
jgi:spore germination protein YaaH